MMSAIGMLTVKIIDALDTLTLSNDFILGTINTCPIKFNSPFIKYRYFMKNNINFGQILKLIIKKIFCA